MRPAPCACRNLTLGERAAKKAGEVGTAIRFRVPREGVTKFEDAVFGPREVQNAEIEDFVLLRSNGLPTYQLERGGGRHRHADFAYDSRSGSSLEYA